MTGQQSSGSGGVLDELAAAAAVRRDAWRHLADLVADDTRDRSDIPTARARYAAATETWAELIRRAVYTEGIPDVARAAGCTRATVYARSRQ